MQITLPIRLGFAFNPDTSYQIWEEFAGKIEEIGFDSIWAASNLANYDPYPAMVLAAQKTSKIPIGLSLANPYTRHPASTAVAALSMGRFTQGRFILSYGAGTLDGLHALGMEWEHPLLSCREAIILTQRIFTGEKTTFHGKTLFVSDFQTETRMPPGQRIPIYLGCRRKGMLQLAGELCDGVIISHPSLDILPYDLEQIEKGALKAKRTLMPDTFCVSAIMPFCANQDSDAAKRYIKNQLAIPFISITQRELDAAGIPREEVAAVQSNFTSRSPSAFEKAASYISDDVVDKLGIAGTPEECLERIIAYENAGLQRIVLLHSFLDRKMATTSLELSKKVILPSLSH